MDERVTGGRGWTACGASVVGAMHRQRGLGCDDAYGYGIAGDFVVAAVADGAGSVSGTSAWGAYAACQSVVDDALNPVFIEGFRAATAESAAELVRWLFDGALQRVRRRADAMGLDVALLSTTLCVAVANQELSVFGQVGDGVIAVEHSDRIETVLIERKTEYANATSFIQSERGLDEVLHTVTRAGATAFALSTDGMTYKITDVATGAAYDPFFRGCWQHVRAGASASSFAALLAGIEDDQTGDDKTMVLVARTDDGRVADGAVIGDSSAPPGDGSAAHQPWMSGRTDPLPVPRDSVGVVAEAISVKRWWGRRGR